MGTGAQGPSRGTGRASGRQCSGASLERVGMEWGKGRRPEARVRLADAESVLLAGTRVCREGETVGPAAVRPGGALMEPGSVPGTRGHEGGTARHPFPTAGGADGSLLAGPCGVSQMRRVGVSRGGWGSSRLPPEKVTLEGGSVAATPGWSASRQSRAASRSGRRARAGGMSREERTGGPRRGGGHGGGLGAWHGSGCPSSVRAALGGGAPWGVTRT